MPDPPTVSLMQLVLLYSPQHLVNKVVLGLLEVLLEGALLALLCAVVTQVDVLTPLRSEQEGGIVFSLQEAQSKLSTRYIAWMHESCYSLWGSLLHLPACERCRRLVCSPRCNTIKWEPMIHANS